MVAPRVKRKGWLHWPTLTIDLGRSMHRGILFFTFIGLAVAGTVFLVSGLKFYEYAESSEFCGTICHPMKSEFARYERSAHANVECAQCHVGPGAAMFVKSKLNGVKELYAFLADSYSRPIKSPVHNLRPARDTCEQCHTPTSFKDNIIKTIVHYDDDEANTPIQSTLILKMGGWQEATGKSEGIHWHMTNPVYYIAADAQRQVILWVGKEQPDGSLKEYYARDMLNMARTEFVEEARARGEVRQMDCIDCHNRTAHYIPSPGEVVDEAISSGLIPANLPYVRAKAAELMMPAYPNEKAAFESIDGLADFYRARGYSQGQNEGTPGTPGQQSEVDAAIATLKQLYATTHFPDQGLNWQTNPNNERHSPFPGCFRCHDGKHVAVDPAGNEVETISAECNLCHTVPITGRGSDMLVEAPVIVGAAPASHSDFRWTTEHRTVTDEDRQDCYTCHGQGFCSNQACHNLSHPPDMQFKHADEYYKRGDQVCYTCHQDVLCSQCHPGGIISNP